MKRFLLLAALLLLAPSALSLGTCFGTTWDEGRGACLTTDEATCINSYGAQFFSEPIDWVLECRSGCCCEAMESGRSPYGILKGVCDTYKGTFIDLNEEDCQRVCKQKDRCKPDCVENQADCTGLNGEVVDTSKTRYYCWRDGLEYVGQTDCTNSCNDYINCQSGVQITEKCWCGGKLYSNGYCCSGGSYSSTGCTATNSCLDADKKCCDACAGSETSFVSGNYNPSSPSTTCSSENPVCCETCARDVVECCEKEWQCSDKLTGDYSEVCAEGEIACGAPCEKIEMCEIGKIGDVDYSTPECGCKEDYMCTNFDPTCTLSELNRYCCESGKSPYPCESQRFSFGGYVFNITAEKKIAGASLDITTARNKYRTQTGSGGYYSINDYDPSYGLGTALVQAEGFYPESFIINYPPQQVLNFNLTPLMGSCSVLPAPKNLNALHVSGRKEVKVNWEEAIDTIGYILTATKETEGAFIETGAYFTKQSTHIDTHVLWGNTYSYSVRAVYSNGQSNPSTASSINLGDSRCEGREKNFCFGGKFADCDGENRLIETSCARGEVCIANGEAGAECAEVECKSGTNPFGLFCIGGECPNTNCYYDYSNTTVDFPKGCEGKSCFSYESQSACINDECHASSAYGSDNGCGWIYTYEEFGKGLCYDNDYKGIEYCSMCSEGASPFFNTGCSQDVCSKIGACFSKEDSCLNCEPGITRCDDFKSQESCINAHGLNRNASVGRCGGKTPSDDACGLGSCRWDGASCFKDADGDARADCPRGDPTCNRKYVPYTTNPRSDLGQTILNAEGRNFEFFITGGEPRSLNYCVDKENTCCPETIVSEFYPQDNVADVYYALINPTASAIIEDGSYFIRYYSIDSYNNIEDIKSSQFYVDANVPMITSLIHNTVEKSDGNYTEIRMVSDECISCSHTMHGFSGAPASSDLLSFSSDHMISYKNLPEGNYKIEFTCKDRAGNKIEFDYGFDIDLIKGIIYLGDPNNRILNSSRVTFELSTSSNASCALQAYDNFANGVPFNELPGKIATMENNTLVPYQLYNFTKTLSLKENTSYVIQANCTFSDKSTDIQKFYFTIDTQPPVTVTEPAVGGGSWLRRDADLLAKIKFMCEDPVITGRPGESKCNSTYYCISNDPTCQTFVKIENGFTYKTNKH